MSRSTSIQGTQIKQLHCACFRHIVLALLLVALLSACQPNGEAISPSDVTDGQPAEASTIQAGWETSPHADTFVVDPNNENSACARCHAPVSFIPTMEDIPSGCFSCKFEIEDPPPFISESEWTPVECKVCHEVDRNNNVTPEFKWLEIAAIEEYAEVTSVSELCQNCHTGADLPDHTAIEVSGVHQALVCTECHDAHTTASSCSASGCHEDWQDIDPAIVGHDSDHEGTSCIACHDASGLHVGPGGDTSDQWITYVSHSVNDKTVDMPFASHSIQLEVSCERCHFADNPWELTTDIESAPAS